MFGVEQELLEVLQQDGSIFTIHFFAGDTIDKLHGVVFSTVLLLELDNFGVKLLGVDKVGFANDAIIDDLSFEV